MLKSKLENIIFGNQFLGIEVFSELNSQKVHGIIVDKKKNNLVISDTFKFDNLEGANFDGFSNLPTIITLYTDKVLIKESELTEKNDIVLVKKNFPNLTIEEFYFDIWRMDGKAIISIARKNYIDEIINLFQENNKLNILAFNIGISNIKHLTTFISEDDILFNSKSFNKKNISISSNESNHSKIYSVNGINIKSDNLISFSSVVNFISESSNGSIDQLNIFLKNEFFQKNFYKKYIKFFTFTLLGILLLNFLIFNYYYNKSNEVNILSSNEIENQKKIENLKRIIVDKEKNVTELSHTNTQRISSILNKIGKSVPSTIILNELQFQPLLKKGNSEVLTEYSGKNIIVAGNSNSNIEFTNWIENLSSFENIHEVIILQFEKEDSITSFKINILIKWN